MFFSFLQKKKTELLTNKFLGFSTVNLDRKMSIDAMNDDS